MTPQRSRPELLVESRSNTTASADSAVTAIGGVAVAANTTTLNLGSASAPATTTTSIGTSAFLKGLTVTVGARVTGLNLTDTADEEADGLGSGATANALMTIHDQTKVSLASNSVVTGETVTINSSHEHVKLESKATATAYAVIGVPLAEARVDYQSMAHVFADAGALVAGGVVNVNAIQNVDNYSRTSTEHSWQDLGLGTPADRTGSLNAQRKIEWNAISRCCRRPNRRVVRPWADQLGPSTSRGGLKKDVSGPTFSSIRLTITRIYASGRSRKSVHR